MDIASLQLEIARGARCPTCVTLYHALQPSRSDEADNRPRLLPCSHTLCSHCVQTLLDIDARSDARGSSGMKTLLSTQLGGMCHVKIEGETDHWLTRSASHVCFVLSPQLLPAVSDPLRSQLCGGCATPQCAH